MPHDSLTNCENVVKDRVNLNYSGLLWTPKLPPSINHFKQSMKTDYSDIFGFNHGINSAFDHQFPTDCSSSKFMVLNTGLLSGGFASSFHMLSAGLALAMNSDRILLEHPLLPGHDTKYCLNHTGYSCYLQTISSCTIDDALKDTNLNDINQTNPNEVHSFTSNRTIIVSSDWDATYIPKEFSALLTCSPIEPDFYYYWWRAVAAAFFFRPNQRTLETINDLNDFPINNLPVANSAKWISIHIRHGDKWKEMKLVQLKEYINSAMIARQLVNNHSNITNDVPTIFLQSDDETVYNATTKWGKDQNFTVIYSPSRKYLNPTIQRRIHEVYDAVSYEYLTMINNIRYHLLCDIWIGTLGSNVDRLVDELRSTIAHRAFEVYIDLSEDSCCFPPCFNGPLFDLGW